MREYNELVQAVRSGDITTIQQLIDDGIDVNFNAPNQTFAILMLAIDESEASDNTIPLLLIEAGVDVNVHDSSGFNPLYQAIRDFNIELINVLLERGADANAGLWGEGWTPISYFNSYDFFNINFPDEAIILNIVNSLLTHGADPNGGAMSALQWAADKNFVTVAERLLQVNVDINFSDPTGWTAFMMAACSNSSLPMMQFLYEHGADVYIRDLEGNCAFELANERNNQAKPAYFIRSCIDKNLRSTNGDTILHSAVRNQDVWAVRTYIDLGGSCSAVNHQGQTALALSEAPGYIGRDIQKILRAEQRRRECISGIGYILPPNVHVCPHFVTSNVISFLSLKDYSMFSETSKSLHFPIQQPTGVVIDAEEAIGATSQNEEPPTKKQRLV